MIGPFILGVFGVSLTVIGIKMILYAKNQEKIKEVKRIGYLAGAAFSLIGIAMAITAPFI